ncbi:MAG TPA: hypothetical protein DEB73_03525 [Candidatus Magasanikbacteria bacterium]|uniref:Uncharacterized protein n=2 Tax=Candidatus Magasanikiibacteriota TaxID=1752731 RepID=A0A0G0ZKA2_9BACT|nr:MAG: hypothetical protein UU49_C0027G0006 [Candidatus Magasanikbacteria bacterium GW2011_GWC2_41_17]KKS13408.1 MAG: hypothetical protein UU69_C0006G0016 [Candidatus Magasanikbacteria bacterium GW2011_GWA2_41_55]HBV58300.1 hypothetical protein [Candidatus Magasanikbacteria bacterium]HBX16207.1 hypothetical protein [Candidatus Magasanikbacteria bacterium]
MATETASVKKGRARASFQELMRKYPDASLEEASGVLHAMAQVVATDVEEEIWFNFLMREAEHAPERELQELAMKFLARKMDAHSYFLRDCKDQQRIHACLALLSRTSWREHLTARDWKTVQDFVAERVEDECKRERFNDDAYPLSPMFNPAVLDQALINTCNWTLLIDKRMYRVIPKLYETVLRRVAGSVSPAEYQSGRYLPESGLFRGEYSLRAFNMMKLAESLAMSELKMIGRDVVRMTVLCGDTALVRGLSEPDAGRANTLFALVATALDEMGMRQRIESILPIPTA